MQFKPLSDEELAVQALIPEGVYRYKVIQAKDKISKAGNEYTTLTLKVYDDQGHARAVFTNMALIKLLNHFCKVNNMINEYESGNIPATSFIGRSSGMVVLGIEPEKPNPQGGTYPAKNVVKDYIGELARSTLQPLGKKTGKIDMPTYEELDDDLPF